MSKQFGFGAVVMTLALPLMAAGPDPQPPQPSETSSTCEGSQIFDEKTGACLPAQESRFDDQTRLDAVRELAHGGDFARAAAILATLEAPGSSRALTYRGFVARKLGDPDAALALYAAALRIDPNNLLARSYRGQAYLKLGNRTAAERELRQIRARGGDRSWPEQSLLAALSGGAHFDY